MATVTKVTRRHRTWQVSVDDYMRMIEAGILSEKDRVFLVGHVPVDEIFG